MNKWFRIGAALAALGVILGAFGAHGLKAVISPDMLAVYETGVRYHLIHAVGLLAVGVAGRHPRLDTGAWLLCIGIVLFSGSLYALALTGVRMLGIITPFGGLAFIAGWLVLALGVKETPPA